MVKKIGIWGGVLFAALNAGCLTLEDGEKLRSEIRDVRNAAMKNEQKAAQLAEEMDVQLKRYRVIVDDAARVATRNSADVGGKVDKLTLDMSQVVARLDELQRQEDATTKQFQDFRAGADTKLEQLSNTVTSAKAPPVPDSADGVYAEADKRLQAQQWLDARRLFEAFVNRYPQDARAAKAQFSIGEAYYGEKRWANAIGAYTKVIDNFSKADIVPDAMFKNGLAFYALKYCGDAKVYFTELLKRYPKTAHKKDATDQLKKLGKDLKNKAACGT